MLAWMSFFFFPFFNIQNQQYRNDPKYWDRQAWANSVDPDQMPQNVASDQVYIFCHSSNTILNTSTDNKIEFYNF